MDEFSCLFLDSGGGWAGRDESEDSLIRFGQPKGLLRSESGIVTIETDSGTTLTKRDPLSVLEGLLAEGYIAAGYIGYEYASRCESGFEPARVKEDGRYPDLKFLLYREEDVERENISENKNMTMRGLSASEPKSETVTETAPVSNMSRDEYIRMVDRAKEYIRDGDVYQINLSQRFTSDIGMTPIECFLRMFHVQHVPFACYLDFGDFQISSGSMELFLRKKGETLTTGPIKGTIERGITPEMDAIKKAKLVSSEKERAENLMIVDLMRNDLARVCRAGTVKVKRLFDVETYATLHQLVSEVEGRLVRDMGISSIIRNMFPPGSVTGAPKKRVIEIIDMLEPHYRGPYCGALGLFFPNGDFTLSVGIRLAVTEGRKTTFWVGGGIVWDSDAEKEYDETILKSLAIKKALGFLE